MAGGLLMVGFELDQRAEGGDFEELGVWVWMLNWVSKVYEKSGKMGWIGDRCVV